MKFDISNTDELVGCLTEEYPCLIGRVVAKKVDREVYGVRKLVERNFIEINNLDELIELSKDVKHELIISTHYDIPEIEIYDDYRE